MSDSSGQGDRARDDIRARLSAALRDAMKARDPIAVSALRSALAAISNAEAVPAGDGASPRTSSPHVAGAAAGLGAAEVPRLNLGEAEVASIIRTEVAGRLDAAAAFERGGRAVQAVRLRREAEVLAAIVSSLAEFLVASPLRDSGLDDP